MSSEALTATDLSVVVPVYNGEKVLAATMRGLSDYFQTGSNEVIIVENGSTDRSLQLAKENALNTEHVLFHVLQSDKGMGNALRRGILASSGARILLTADDLPFGFDDLDEDSKLTSKPTVVIGSKAHRLSSIHRGLTRSISTNGFKLLRKVILNSKVGDSQGTLIVDGDWLRSMAGYFDDPGFLFSTQVVYAAERQGLEIVEVPVRLAPQGDPKQTTVRPSDVFKMAKGLLAMRSRRREFATASKGRTAG